MSETKRIYELLELVKNNPIKSESRRKTFMEVTRYPHYENVVSNVLAFFFDDSEEHGMSSLWLDSLLSLRRIETTESNINVQREYYTSKGNRIDLLIESENYAVCIENKIFADISNDLQDYLNTVSYRYAGKPQDIVCYVISPKLLPKYPLYEIFLNVTYSELFEAVRLRMGDYLDKCDNTWLLYMKDFMTTVESLSEDNKMNKEFEALFKDYHLEIESIENLKNNYIKAIKEDAYTVNEALLENASKINVPEGMTVDIWNSPYEGKSQTRVSVVVDIFLDGDKKRCLTVETSRDCWGWNISLYPRNRTTELVMSITNTDKFLEQRHPAQSGNDNSNKQFYCSHFIIQNIEDQITVEALVDMIISVTNDVIEWLLLTNK